ncbi:hypothetical protein KKA87_10490 [bacterium]|nr:hypothetical protein [bacterium]MBU1872701.1 hypothetical protein [bacterium]
MNKSTLKFIAEKSKYLIDTQIQSYRSLFTKAGTIIGITSVFLPLFLFIINTSHLLIKIVSIIPIIVLVIGLIRMLLVMKSPPLFRGYGENKFEELLDLDEISLYISEISANKKSVEENDVLLAKQNRHYNKGIFCFIFAIVFSVLLLCTDIFIKTINGGYKMTEENTKKDEVQTDQQPQKVKKLLDVDIKDLKRVSEGKEIKSETGKIITETNE